MKAYHLHIIAVVILLSGCANSPPKTLSEGPTMQEVLRSHMGSGASLNGPIQRLGPAEDEGMTGYTRNANNELRNLFRRLPNPDLCFYVSPHLTDDHLPVPGYTSCISMYKQSHYALPGEIGVQPLLSNSPLPIGKPEASKTSQ